MGLDEDINAVRETDGWVLRIRGSYVCSVVRFTDSKAPAASPSAKALGYSLSVRFADEEKILLRQSHAALRLEKIRGAFPWAVGPASYISRPQRLRCAYHFKLSL